MIGKKIYNCIFSLLFLIIALTACAGERPVKNNEFSCSTTLSTGIVRAFADNDTDWYLFLPAYADISQVSLNVTAVSRCDKGEYIADDSVITHAFAKSGDSVKITADNGMVYTVTVMQSDLPSVEIGLTGLTIEDIHRDKNLRAYRTSVNVTDKNDKDNNIAFSGNVQLKGRGNSSWREYEKKGYQLTLPSATPVLGMSAGEKWLLLANSSDDSMLRNAVSFSMASQMDMAFVPDFRFVDLWIDGEYMGTYMLCEKITVESTRLDLAHRDGALFEHDDVFWAEEENSFYNEYLQRHFTLKETLSDRQNTFPIIIDSFDKSVDRFMDYLYSTPSSDVTVDSLGQYIDVDSFAKYYVVNEYLLNKESFSTSFYWYQDGADDVLHLGPVWDFDTSMGTDDPDPSATYGYSYPMFRYLLAAPEFYDYVQRLCTQYRDMIEKLPEYVSKQAGIISSSACMNYIRWDTLGGKNVKNRSLAMADSFEQAVENLFGWLSVRNTLFSVPRCKIVSSTVSEDGKTMNVYMEDEGYTDVIFVVRPHDASQVLSSYCVAEKSDNVWSASVDLSFYNKEGSYVIDALSAGKTIALGRKYIPVTEENDYCISAELSDSKDNINIRMTDSGLCSNVVFTIRNWCTPDSQEMHLQGYKDENGTWYHDVSAEYFTHSGTYRINAYSVENDIFTLVAADTVEYLNSADFPVTATVSQDGSVMEIRMPGGYGREKVVFAVWSIINGQDDIVWIPAVCDENNQWYASADMALFEDIGAYAIHAFENYGTDIRLLNASSVSFTVTKDPVDYPLSVELAPDKSHMYITLETAQQCAGVSFAVWSNVSGQADLKWFDAVGRNGVWTAGVDMSQFENTGLYNIHAYEKTEGVLTAMLNMADVEI